METKFKVGDHVRHNDSNYSFSPGYGTITSVGDGSCYILHVEGAPLGQRDGWAFFEHELELLPETRFYADLNPRYGQRGEARWRIFVRRGDLINIVESIGSWINRKACEQRAAQLNDVLRELDGHFINININIKDL